MKKNIEICDCNALHQDIIDEVKKHIPEETVLYDLSDLYKILGDSTRTKILWAIDIHEMCVCDLAVLLNMTKSAISHQLKILRDYNLVKARKDGKNVFYSLADNHVRDIFEKGIEHIKEEENGKDL